MLDQAKVEARDMGDEYISTEHVLMAISKVGETWAMDWQGLGLKKEAIHQVLKETRGGQKVDDPNAESRFAALKKYARDLNEWAEKNKLDPVIGRDYRNPKSNANLVQKNQKQSSIDWRTRSG